MKALEGVRILDLTRHMSGPYGTAMLSDYGAEVIKIESAGNGDPSRSTGSAQHGGENALYLMWNRGKRSVALNLRDPEAVEVVRTLAAQSDVFVENYRPGIAEEMGLGYEVLREINPRLIYISVSGFGRGPLEAWPATDPVVQAMSGISSVTGEIGGPPILVGVPIADYAGAMQVIQSTLLGLLARAKTGAGQLIEVSMLHALMAALTTRLALYWGTGQEPERLGGSHSAVAPYNILRTQDGHMVAGVWGAGEAWPRFCEAIDRPDLVTDPRFLTNELRVGNRDILVPLLEEITRSAPTSVWEKRFRAVHVLYGPVLDFPSLLSHEHVRRAGIVTSVEHPTAGRIPQLSPTLKLSETPGEIAGPPPLLGQHTVEVLKEIGYGDVDVDRLISTGAVRSTSTAGAGEEQTQSVPPQ